MHEKLVTAEERKIEANILLNVSYHSFSEHCSTYIAQRIVSGLIFGSCTWSNIYFPSQKENNQTNLRFSPSI